jgi:hypothetical protein
LELEYMSSSFDRCRDVEEWVKDRQRGTAKNWIYCQVSPISEGGASVVDGYMSVKSRIYMLH